MRRSYQKAQRAETQRGPSRCPRWKAFPSQQQSAEHGTERRPLSVISPMVLSAGKWPRCPRRSPADVRIMRRSEQALSTNFIYQSRQMQRQSEERGTGYDWARYLPWLAGREEGFFWCPRDTPPAIRIRQHEKQLSSMFIVKSLVVSTTNRVASVLDILAEVDHAILQEQ
jgi:hypothetical protein